jgi:hypothetical protein
MRDLPGLVPYLKTVHRPASMGNWNFWKIFRLWTGCPVSFLPFFFHRDFFSSPPRALPDVPESAEDKALELLRNPQTVDLLHTLSQLPFSQLQSTFLPFFSSFFSFYVSLFVEWRLIHLGLVKFQDHCRRVSLVLAHRILMVVWAMAVQGSACAEPTPTSHAAALDVLPCQMPVGLILGRRRRRDRSTRRGLAVFVVSFCQLMKFGFLSRGRASLPPP